MKEAPETLNEALQLANRQESIEEAQKREQHHEESFVVNKKLHDGQQESSTCASASERVVLEHSIAGVMLLILCSN